MASLLFALLTSPKEDVIVVYSARRDMADFIQSMINSFTGVAPTAEQMLAAQIRARHQAREMRDAELLQHGAADEYYERVSVDVLAARLRDFEWVIDMLEAPNAAQLLESRQDHQEAMARIRNCANHWREIVDDAMLRAAGQIAATQIQRRFRRWHTTRQFFATKIQGQIRRWRTTRHLTAATQIQRRFRRWRTARHFAVTKIQCRIHQWLRRRHIAATQIQCRVRRWRTVMRVALVIVNFDYGIEGDAIIKSNALGASTELREMLSDLGFRTPKVREVSPLRANRLLRAMMREPEMVHQPLTNLANKRQMERTIQNFIDRIRCSAEVCLAFTGHGVQVNGEAFLAPTRANWESGTNEELVGLRGVMALFNARGAQIKRQLKVIFLLDCCRTYPKYDISASKSKKVKVDYTRWANMEWAQFYIMYATSPGEPAFIGDDVDSLTRTFTKAVRDQQQAHRELNLEYLIYNVRRSLLQRKPCQVSWSHDCLRAPLRPCTVYR